MYVINKNKHRYRFKHAMDNVALCNEKYSDELMEKTYAKVSQSIDAHKKAVELVSLCIIDIIWITFYISFF